MTSPNKALQTGRPLSAALCDYSMKLKLLVTFLVLPVSICASAEGDFNFLGAFDNVQSSETGHCYGIDVLVWELSDKQIIGLLSVEDGLCGDPPCSALIGTINDDKITFETSTSIYGEQYLFSGKFTSNEISGLLNGNETNLVANSYASPLKSIIEWCSFWSQVPRCQGVKDYCQ